MAKGKMMDLYYAIAADIEHGECFYDKEMFDQFIANVDRLKELAQQEFKANQECDEDA